MTIALRPQGLEQAAFSRAIEFPGVASHATTTITCVSNANMADTDYFALSDGLRNVTYEYDKSGNGVTAGRIAWAVAGGAAGAIEAAGTLKTAIDANQPGFTVVDNADGTLTLTNKLAGAVGNVTAAADNVSNAGFILGSSTGGRDATQLAASYTKKLEINPSRIRIDEIEMVPAVGIAGHASAYWEIGIYKGTALVVADFTFTAEADDDLITRTAHGLLTGDGPIRVANSGGGLPGALAAATDYWVIKVSSSTFKLATSLANALDGTGINISSDGTGTQTLSDTSLTKRQVRMASWSTDSDVVGQGTLTANLPVNLVLSSTAADTVAAEDDLITAAFLKFSTASNLPAGRITVRGRTV